MPGPEETAAWLVEAWETGNPLAPFPPELAPADRAAGEAVAASLVERLGIAVCGVRLLPAPDGGWLSAPLLTPRLVPAKTPVALATLRHARVSAAVVAVLAERLTEAAPVFAALHPALDVAAERYRDPAADAAHLAADLGALGMVVAGRPFRGAVPEEGSIRCGPAGTRPRAERVPLAARLADAAAEARRWGDWPAGSALVVAGLGGAARPAAAGRWSVAVGPIGRLTAILA